jgi:hypothetical protein
VDKPVGAQECTEAVVHLQNNYESTNPSIHAYPKTPQFVVAIGMVMKLLSTAFVKMGHWHEFIKRHLKSIHSSFESEAKDKISRLIESYEPT